MREIKFRAWDGEKMHQSYLVGGFQFADALKILSDEAYAIANSKVREWKVMQFTGLKDANGTDIYEGDLVTHSWAKDSAITPVEVRYKAPRFYLERTSNERQYAGVEIGAASEWVIVGNIYENPELVELPATRVTGS